MKIEKDAAKAKNLPVRSPWFIYGKVVVSGRVPTVEMLKQEIAKHSR